MLGARRAGIGLAVDGDGITPFRHVDVLGARRAGIGLAWKVSSPSRMDSDRVVVRRRKSFGFLVKASSEAKDVLDRRWCSRDGERSSTGTLREEARELLFCHRATKGGVFDSIVFLDEEYLGVRAWSWMVGKRLRGTISNVIGRGLVGASRCR